MVFHNKTGRLAFLSLFCLLLMLGSAYAGVAKESDKTPVSKPESEMKAGSEEPKGFAAVAVYYARRYQGRRTTSGEIFDHKKLTAAHPSIPLGTRVKVVNTANNRTVVVKVNDRCRKRSFELIDLTRAAATKLGYYGRQGRANVRVIPLDDQLALNTEAESSESETEEED